MQKNDASSVVARLFEGKRHEMVQITQIRGDEKVFRMRPAVAVRISHGIHLIPESVSPAKEPGCATEHCEM
jgi:hypothetical protein